MAREQCFNSANGDRPGVRNLLVTVTDGVPFPPNRRQPTIEEAKTIRDSGITMIAGEL